MSEYLLEAVYNTTNHTYEIKNADQILLNCEMYLDQITLGVPEEITNDDEKKIVKKARTEINKKLKELKDGRIQANKIVLGKFNQICKSIETEFESISKDLSLKLDTYESKEKEKKWTLKGFSTKKADLEEIKWYAWELFQIELKITD